MKTIFVIVILLAGFPDVKAQVDPGRFIDSVAAGYLKKNHGLALVIGVNVEGTERVFAYGETEKGSGIRPDATSVFEIGQLTQVFTAALYAQMNIRGEINPDLPVSSCLPVDVPSPVYQEVVCEPVQPQDYRMEKGTGLNPVYTAYVCKPDKSSAPQPILVCYLGTHTSGLPSKPGNLKGNRKNPYANYSKEDLYDFLRGYSLPQPIGYDFRYSDLNMALLGHILELKSGKPFALLLDSVIFSPLKMQDTKLHSADYDKRKLLAGHSSNGRVAERWTTDIMAPAVGGLSSLADLMKFLSMNITRDRSGMKDLFDYMHNPRIRFTNKEYGTAEAALGWMVSSLGSADKKYVWLDGETGGFASFIGFVETTHTGIVILSNCAVPVKEMGEEILREINNK